jgi:pimeloyl-ACP methyl ester carboxylesterase
MPEPLVLLPGLQSDHRSWVHQIRHFEKRRDIIVPHGQQFCDSISDMVETVLPQLPERFHLFAWSMGGYITFQMLDAVTDRLASLVLVSTSARPEDPASTHRRHELIELAEREGMGISQRLSISQSCLDDSLLDPEARSGVYQASVEIGLEGYRAQQQAIIQRPDSRGNLSLVNCPTLVIVGDSDTVTPPECAFEIHAGISGSRLEVIPYCGHCSPLEQPVIVNRLFDEWLDEAESRANSRAERQILCG